MLIDPIQQQDPLRNRLLVKQMFKAIDSHDWGALQQIFHPNVVYERGGYEAFRGRERLMEFYREERVLASGEHILDQILVDGGHGACWGRFEGKKKDGSAVKLAFADVYGFDTGKVVFRKSYFFVPLV